MVDQQNAEAALGAPRVASMMGALGRVKARLEGILGGSTGAVVFTLTWANPMNPMAIGEAQTSQSYLASAVAAKDRLTVQLGCPADFNGDGNVDPDDLADFIACYFSLPPCPEGDFNHDGTVDSDDLADDVAAHFEGC